MKRVLAAAAILVSLSGCSGFNAWYTKWVVGPEHPLVCRHAAITCAQIAGEEGLPFKIYMGKLWSGERHVQTYVKWTGEDWMPCVARGDSVMPNYYQESWPAWQEETMIELSIDDALERYFR